jgi:hypothetical protein
MKLVNDRSANSLRSSMAVKIQVKITVAAIPTANPKTRVPYTRVAGRRQRVTMPIQTATSGPNSGPTTIAPTIRIG